MSKSWGPVTGSARPWVELASLPPAVTWELADVINSGGSVFATAASGQGLVRLTPLGLCLCLEPTGLNFAANHRSPTPFSRGRAFSPHTWWPRCKAEGGEPMPRAFFNGWRKKGPEVHLSCACRQSLCSLSLASPRAQDCPWVLGSRTWIKQHSEGDPQRITKHGTDVCKWRRVKEFQAEQEGREIQILA